MKSMGVFPWTSVSFGSGLQFSIFQIDLPKICRARHLESFYLQSTAGFELHTEKFPMLFWNKKSNFKGLITLVGKRVALTFEAEIALGLSLSMTNSMLEDYFLNAQLYNNKA